MAITPLTLYFTANPGAGTNSGGATYTPVAIPSTSAGGAAFTQDQRVLAYALAAEYLETALYQQAYLYLTGQPLPSATGTTVVADALGYVYGTGSATVNGTSVTAINLGVSTADPIAIYLAEFASIEASHAAFISSALSGDPYPAGVAFAFGLHTLTTKVQVAQAIYGAELTGVSAYTGAIPSFSAPATQQYPSYLQIAASILGTEARHTTALAATINAANGNGGIETAPQYNEGGPLTGPVMRHGLDVPLPPDDILNAGGSGVPGVLTGSGASTGGAGGTLGPVSGPHGAAVGAANQTAYPGTSATTYNGYVYLLS